MPQQRWCSMRGQAVFENPEVLHKKCGTECLHVQEVTFILEL